MPGMPNPSRNVPPCKDCTRPEKKPGCHADCNYYKSWKAELARINEARKQYLAKPFSKII